MVDSGQRSLTQLLLRACEGTGIVLAGSGAIREHGLINRATEDIDLFGSADLFGAPERYLSAIERIDAALVEAGYDVASKTGEGLFRHYEVIKDTEVYKIDVTLDYRSQEPVVLDIGATLSCDDAVANKVDAVFSRGEARDYLDLDAIRQNGPYTDEELLELASRNDSGFDPLIFTYALQRVNKLTPSNVERYGITPEQLEDIQRRLTHWQEKLANDDAIDTVPIPARKTQSSPSLNAADEAARLRASADALSRDRAQLAPRRGRSL